MMKKSVVVMSLTDNLITGSVISDLALAQEVFPYFYRKRGGRVGFDSKSARDAGVDEGAISRISSDLEAINSVVEDDDSLPEPCRGASKHEDGKTYLNSCEARSLSAALQNSATTTSIVGLLVSFVAPPAGALAAIAALVEGYGASQLRECHADGGFCGIILTDDGCRPQECTDMPDANIEIETEQIVTDRPVTLDGGVSDVPTGKITSYEWTVEMGSSEVLTRGTGDVLEVTFPTEGKYRAYLTVTSEEGYVNTASKLISVGTGSSLENRIVLEGTEPTATYYAVDVSGEIEQADGQLGDSEVTADESDRVFEERALGSVGDDSDGYRFSGELQNRDELAQLSGAIVHVNGETIGTDLSADFTVDPSDEVLKGTTLRFDASASKAPESSRIEGYSWSVVDAESGELFSSGNGKEHEATLRDVGNYDVTLEVVDSEGRRSRKSKSVTVTPIPAEKASAT